MYCIQSGRASEFMSHQEILKTQEFVRTHQKDNQLIKAILRKGAALKGLNHREAALLLECDDPDLQECIFSLAQQIKTHFYGNRIVLFAPLYLSNYCVNSCLYCPYRITNRAMIRKKLSQEEIRQEVLALQKMGHKRIALETGEDPLYNPIEYILESIQTIYDTRYKNGAIRRVNVNIAATSVDNYQKLKAAAIGTYILFQETYDQKNYQRLHPKGPKHNYDYHTEAMDRAMLGGIDDVGIGVLFGLSNYQYDFIGLLMHAEHLKARFGVGPHTISVPRLCKAQNVDLSDCKHILSDQLFKRMIAVLRIAVPYTGIIVSTRETPNIRADVLKLGISQISGGSSTSVGGYQRLKTGSTAQFDVNDHRSLSEITSWLIDKEHIPSFCTACYRKGRTGERFMDLLQEGKIAKCCFSNALLSLKEYLVDYASEELYRKGNNLIDKQLKQITNSETRQQIIHKLIRIEAGERDLHF